MTICSIENEVHKLVDNGQALSENVLTSIYSKINEQYYGPMGET